MNLETNTKIAEFEVSKTDFVEFERKQRQFLNELAMKRTQVEELKTELSLAKLKIHEQSRSLESAKNTIDEQENSLKLVLKNSRFLEDTFQAKKDSMSRTHLQQETAVAERESLRELLQKTELQNYNLNYELNELRAHHNCDVAYQKEFVNQDSKIREKIAELTEAITNLINDQNDIKRISDQIGTCEELQKTVIFYREEFYKTKEKYRTMEGKYVKCKAIVDEFQNLCNENNNVFQVSPESHMVVQQCEKTITVLKEQLKIQQEISANLTNNFKAEKENNITLCLREKELETQIEESVKEKKMLKEEDNEFKIELQHKETLNNEAIEIPDN